MGCYQNFYAKDGNGNALPFNVLFRLYNSSGVRVPTPEIEPGTSVTMWLDEGTTYEATPSNVDGLNNSGAISFVACNSGVTFVYTPIPPGNGFTIRTSSGLATKNVLVAHVVKMPFIGLVGPDPDLWYWPQAFDYVGGKWYMTDPATTYRVEVGSVFETIPSFNKTYGTGSFADGIHCVVLAEGEGGVGSLIFKGSDVFQLHRDSPTEIYLVSTSTDILTEAIMGPVCDYLEIPRGSECDAFWAEFYDPVFVANYISIITTPGYLETGIGKDTLGNERNLTTFDKIALPFAVLGSLPGLSLLPFKAVVTVGLASISKAGAKFSDAAVQFMLNFSMDASNKISSKDTWYFLDAIGQVTDDHATEIVNALTAGDTSLANTLLRKYAGESKGYWNYHALNDMLENALPTDSYNWLRTQIGLTKIGAGTAINTAKQATLSADDIAKLADVANDADVMEEVGKALHNAVKNVDTIVDPNVKAQKVIEIENIAENFPKAFDDISKASIHDVSGYLIKHDVIENVLGKTTSSANWVMTTKLFKCLFDGVDEVALASSECNGIMAIAKEDPIAIAKAIEDYTTKTDKERLLLSLGKSGTAGQDAAAWIASAKKNFDIGDVHRRFGTTVYDVVNDASQIPMHGPHGVYRTDAIDAIGRAMNSVPKFLQPETGYKFIRDTSKTVRIHATTDHLADLVRKAQAKDTRGIADIFRSAGVDTIQSDLIADQLWNVSHHIDVLGDVINVDDLTKLTDRMVEANVVEGSKLVEDMINRIVKNGTITDVELKSFFDVANHNPVEVALAMEKIPAGALASFQNVLSAKGTKGQILQGLMDTRNNIRSKFGAIGDTLLSSWSRTTPVGLRLSRTSGTGFGSGVFKSFGVHGRLLEWAGDHWKALVAVLGVIGAAKFVTYWFAFEWQPFHAVLRRAGVMESRVAEKYTDVMYSAANDMGDLDWNVDKISVRESVYNSVGILCELLDYAEKNPIPSSKLATMQETFDLYVGSSSGLVGNSLYVDIQKDLRQLLIKYNEQFLECIDARLCTAGDECVTGEMAYSQRKIDPDALANADAYQPIIDAAWKCIPGTGTVGTIRCTSNQTGFAVYLDGNYINHSYGNTWLVIPNVPIGSHTVKIDKGSGYDPEFCEKTVLIVASEIKTVDCQMTKIGVCSQVTDVKIYIDPLSPIEDQTVSFNGSAKSNDPITSWGWIFSDGFTATGQAVTHTFRSAGIYGVELVVTNDCENHASAMRNVTVSEEAVEESGTLLVQKPINAVTKIECTRAWEAIIHVDGQTIGKTTPFSIPFGTDTYIGGHGGPCGTHDITIILSGYDTVSKTITIDDGDTKSWQPEMYPAGTTPTQRTIDIVVPVGSSLYVDGKPITGTTTVGRLTTIFNDLRKR